jgi:hypothetical protein
LESRIVPVLPLAGPVAPAPLPLPSPLVPDPGDQQILNNVLKMAVSNRHVLDSLPVPYVIVASAGGAPPTVTDGHSHAPVKIDADQSKATGLGGSGFDIQVEVDAYVEPVPHLELTVTRLGTAPFATNLSVVVAFPFAGFDLESGLPSTPNLVLGFQTSAAGGAPGGYAPQQEVIDLTPCTSADPTSGTLAGTSHMFQATMATTGAANPLSFILGNLDGTNLTGTLNAAGFRAYVENVPATINATVTTAESALTSPVNSSFALNWQASAASPVKLDYLENVTNPATPATAPGPDFNTSLTANPMPTSEQFSLGVNEPGGQMTLSQQGNAAIGSMTFQKTRSDGLAVIGNGTNVPTQLGLTMNLAGSTTLTDSANVGSFAAQASKAGGFAGSSSFLGYNVGTVGLAVTSAPNLSAGFSRSGTDRLFNAAPATAGNVIGSLEFLASSNSPATVQLPGVTCGAGSWSNPAWDVLSMIDTGTGDTSVPVVSPPGATAAARLLSFTSVQYTQHANWPTIGNALDLRTTAATPLKIYLRTTPTSVLIPGHDIEITEEVQNVPVGHFTFTFDGPTNFHYTTDPLTGIGSVHVCGHIDTLVFDIDAADLPPIFALDWDPDSHLNITSQSAPGVEAFLGHVAGTLSDPNGITLPGYTDVGLLFGTIALPKKLKEAQMRVDHTTSMGATWVATDGSGNTSVQFTTKGGNYAGGIQFASSTNLHDPNLPATPTPASSLPGDYATFNDRGPSAADPLQDMSVGILGIHTFSYVVTNATDQAEIVWDDNNPVPFNLNVNSATGGIYFAQNKVVLTDTISKVPAKLDYKTNLDYHQELDGTDFIPFLDLTFDKNEGLPAGTTLHVHADTLPAITIFDYDPAAGTFSIKAQDTSHQDTQKFGDVILDLECPDGLPGTASVLGAPVKQAIMRLDNVPSFQGTYASTGAGTTIGLMSLAPGLSIGSTQIEISTAQDLPALTAPLGGDTDTVTLSDPGGASAKHLVAQLYGLTNFNYSTSTAAGTQTVVMTQDAPRKMIATVVSNNGKFFGSHNVDAAVTIDKLPTSINLTTDGKSSLSYDASGDIGSITVGGHGGAAEGFFDTTKFSLSATALPARFGFSVNPGQSGGVTITAHTADGGPASAGSIEANVQDEAGLGGGSNKWVRVEAHTLPTLLSLNWSVDDVTHVETASLSSSSPVGTVSFILSSKTKADSAGALDPFTGPGTGSVSRSAYDALIDNRYFPPNVKQRTDLLYGAEVKLSGAPLEDHAVIRKTSDITYYDIQLTGFQSVSAVVTPDGGTATLHIPSPTAHPFYIGYQGSDSNLTAVHIENVPETISVDLKLDDHAHYDASAGAGRIDVYNGPVSAAHNGDEAFRAILLDTPKWVHLDYGNLLNFPGSGDFTAASLFEVILDIQGSSHRFEAGVRMQNLHIDYGMDTNVFTDPIGFSDPLGILPDVTVDTALAVIEAHVHINTAGGAPLAGFFMQEDATGSAAALQQMAGEATPPPAPGPTEYIPTFSGLLANFTSLSFEPAIELDPLNPFSGFSPLDFDVTPDFHGDLRFDFWDHGIHVGIGPLEVLGVTIFPHVGYDKDPSYVDNSPWHLVPLLSYSFLDPLPPLPPMLAAAPAATPTSGPPLPADIIAPLWAEAAHRWAAAGATPDQVSRALATTPSVRDLGGLYLGATVGDRVYIDDNPAGYGWFIDATPGADEEFGPTGNGAAAGRMDLLTVLSHEMGRLFGYDVGDATQHPVMSLTLTPGVRLGDAAPGTVVTADAAHGATLTAAPAETAAGNVPAAALPNPTAVSFLLAAERARAAAVDLTFASSLAGGPTLPPRTPQDEARTAAPTGTAPAALLDVRFATTLQGPLLSRSEADGLMAYVELWPWAAPRPRGEPEFLS